MAIIATFLLKECIKATRCCGECDFLQHEVRRVGLGSELGLRFGGGLRNDEIERVERGERVRGGRRDWRAE
eukprot:1328839-Amorphochlora_amoeboformis.AAC.2